MRQVCNGLTAYCNAGKMYTDKKGNLGEMEVWLKLLNTLTITNILSFTKLKKMYQITYDTIRTKGQFVVHTPRGEVQFKQNNLGLLYIN